MKDQEINEAIAKECGWKFGDYQDAFSFQDGSPHFVKRWLNSDGHPHHHPPDYCNDMNAIRDVVREQSGEFQSRFDVRMRGRLLTTWIQNLTARDWCECFLEVHKEESR